MLQSFIIVWREGFEAFLIVAIIYSYLKKSGKSRLIPALYWGVGASLIASAVLGYCLLQGANQPLWEGIAGIVAAVLVPWLVVHRWFTAATMKKNMETRLSQAAEKPATRSAWLGVFLFTVFMISREGMETALLLIQLRGVHAATTGIFLGLAAAGIMAVAWARFGNLIDLKLFFQVTAIFLFLFILQILIYSFHEFTEAGLFPNSEALHLATEPFSPEGLYGRWLGVVMVGICGFWLLGAWATAGFQRNKMRKF